MCLTAFTIAAEGGKADIAKPLKGLGLGIFEIALHYGGNVFRGTRFHVDSYLRAKGLQLTIARYTCSGT